MVDWDVCGLKPLDFRPVLAGEPLVAAAGTGFQIVKVPDDGAVVGTMFVSLRDLEAAVAAVKKRRRNGK